jgi:hypothetical protein
MRHLLRSVAWVVAVVLTALVPAGADTLVFRNGRRVEGELIGVRDGLIEFQELEGRQRVVRVPRDEVRSIEIDDRHGRPNDMTSERPRGLREREVIVSGDLQFVDSGIDVRSGQSLYFESIGNVWWKKGHKDGPEGERNSPYNPGRPMPRRPAAALIGKIGEDSKDVFFIGSDRGPIRVQAAGRLFLGVNDDHIPDNHGNFRVVVFY